MIKRFVQYDGFWSTKRVSSLWQSCKLWFSQWDWKYRRNSHNKHSFFNNITSFLCVQDYNNFTEANTFLGLKFFLYKRVLGVLLRHSSQNLLLIFFLWIWHKHYLHNFFLWIRHKFTTSWMFVYHCDVWCRRFLIYFLR